MATKQTELAKAHEAEKAEYETVIQQMTKQVEDQRRERKRLEEVILEKDGDIQSLLQGGGNFQLIKGLLSDLNGSMNSIEDICKSSDSNT